MPRKGPPDNQRKSIFVVISIMAIGLILAGAWWLGRPEPKEASKPPQVQDVRLPMTPKAVIDYDLRSGDGNKDAAMKARKDAYGLKKGIDIIAKYDEKIRIGDTTVSMSDIIDKIRLQEGRVLEGDLDAPAAGRSRVGRDDNALGGSSEIFGVYVVRPGDNIWNIHFNFLKEYFKHKGLHLSPTADEPAPGGFSSGVGKLLKFSENLVYIYNIKERKLTSDIGMISPYSKLVIYKMNHIFSLLDQIDYKNVDNIKFDGETIWIPAAG